MSARRSASGRGDRRRPGGWDAAAFVLLAAAGLLLGGGRAIDPAFLGVIAWSPTVTGSLAATVLAAIVIGIDLEPARLDGRLPFAALAAALAVALAAPWLTHMLAPLPGASAPLEGDLRQGAGGAAALVLFAALAAVLLPPGPGRDRMRTATSVVGATAAGLAALLVLLPVLGFSIRGGATGPRTDGPFGLDPRLGIVGLLVAVAAALGTAASRGTVPMRAAPSPRGGFVDRGHLSWLLRNAVEPLVAAAIALPASGLAFGRTATALTVAGGMLVAGVTALVALHTDKRAAEDGFPRIPERTLHLVDAAGGWPASIAGRQWFRHKRAKASYLRTSRGMIVVHLAAVAVLVAGSVLLARARGL